MTNDAPNPYIQAASGTKNSFNDIGGSNPYIQAPAKVSAPLPSTFSPKPTISYKQENKSDLYVIYKDKEHKVINESEKETYFKTGEWFDSPQEASEAYEKNLKKNIKRLDK